MLHFFICSKWKASLPFVPNKKRRDAALFTVGGETGIRTQGTLLAYTHFPGVLLRPLGHLSKDKKRNTKIAKQRKLVPGDAI